MKRLKCFLWIPTAAPTNPIRTTSNKETCSTHVGVEFSIYRPYTNQLKMTVMKTIAIPVIRLHIKAILLRISV